MTDPKPGSIWLREATGKMYAVEGECMLASSGEDGVLYRAIKGGPLIARAKAEFLDGRFTLMPPARTL